MPSLFSRSHQPPKKDRSPAVLVTSNSNAGGDRRIVGLAKTWNGASNVPNSGSVVGEFGTVPQITTSRNTPPSPEGLMRSASTASLLPNQATFLPTNIPVSAQSLMSTDASQEDGTPRLYGFLGGGGRKIVLGLDEVARVIRDVGAELAHRALDTPMIFSNQSLELNQTRMRMLTQTFLKTVRTPTRTPSKSALETFMQDIKFANDHELAWLLRWALSRMTRVREGTREVCHGCIDWEMYEEWRGRERASKYQVDAFTTLSSILPSDIYYYVVHPLFGLLSKFAAHSHNSGLTPHAIASYFAPLLFDIPANGPALTAHTAFVRAAAATEHMLLAYIRSSGGSRDGLGMTDLPFRLQEWVKGYPSMIASDAALAHGRPRRAARVVRCEVASRTVRAYSRDLVVNAETWVDDMPGGWPAYDRVMLKSRRGEASRPKFSSAWRRKMCVRETLPLPKSHHLEESLTFGAPLGQSPTKEDSHSHDGDEGRFASLAGKEWNAFEELGFGSTSASSKSGPSSDINSRLQFDLNESAKMSVAERRQTMDWTDFASPTGGFTRTEPFLSASLSFSTPLQAQITEWPKERDELRRRLHKTQKEATPFTHDTTPRVGPAAGFEGGDAQGRLFLEEAFVDCWTDLLMGAGWVERDELTFKEASWALIEYKATPSRPEEHPELDHSTDPRVTDLYFLFEERVPLDYQMAVADPKRKKSLHRIFSPKKKNRSPMSPPDDFDRMIRMGSQKKLTMPRNDQSVSSSLWHAVTDGSKGGKTKPVPSLPSQTLLTSRPTISRPMAKGSSHSPNSPQPSVAESRETLRDDNPKSIGNGKPSIFKTIRRVKSGSDQRNNARRQREGQREVSMEFEIQSASGLSSGNNSPNSNLGGDSEKWMDILIANGARPMDRTKEPTPTATSPPEISPVRTARPLPPTPADDITPTASRIGGLNIMAGGAAVGAGVGAVAVADILQPPLPIDSHVQHPYDHERATLEAAHNIPPEPVFDHGQGESYAYSQKSQRSTTTDDTSVNPSDSISVRRRADSPPLESPNAVEFPRNSGAYDGIVSPQPRVAAERDAMFSIVDHYGGSTQTSSATEYSQQSEGGLYSGTEPFGHERQHSVGDSVIERAFAGEIRNSAYSTSTNGEELPPPPGMIFDLTPGREPSPARYKHGEPLHFVGEEEEEEEEEYM